MWLPISSIVWKRLLLSMIVLINSFKPSSPIFISLKSQTSSIFGMVDLRAFAGFFLNSFLCILRFLLLCCIRCSHYLVKLKIVCVLCFASWELQLDAEMRWLLFRSCCTNTFHTTHTSDESKFFFRVCFVLFCLWSSGQVSNTRQCCKRPRVLCCLLLWFVLVVTRCNSVVPFFWQGHKRHQSSVDTISPNGVGVPS